MIEIVFKNGDMAHYKPDEYTDYKYDGKYFIVIYEKQWIGFYNLDCVEYIEVERNKQDISNWLSVTDNTFGQVVDCNEKN